ncbi:MAG: histidine kinase [Bacteroidetes bacterium]|nr:histidine kinase [Bacteroidota bacterium]
MSTLQPESSTRSQSRTAEIAVVLGFWTLLGALTLVRRSLDPRGPEGLATPELWMTLIEYGFWVLLTPLVFWLARRFPLERNSLAQRIVLHLAIALVVAALFEVVRLMILRPMIIQHTMGLRGGRFGRGPGHLNPVFALKHLQFLDELIVYLAVLSAGFARDYFFRLRERQREAARLTAQLAEARLSALRMQLNPHFLFNTLHAVSALVERDPTGVRRMIAKLSTLLRHTLDTASAQEVPLRDELQFLRDYLDIQQVRFQGRLEVVEDVPSNLLDALVPNLILQPLVENAVEHGVSGLEDGGRIDIGAQRDGNNLILSVRDNGPGIDPEMPLRENGVGLRNTRERIEGMYGDAGHLVLEPAEGGGLRVVVTLPYHTAGDLRTTGVGDASMDI